MNTKEKIAVMQAWLNGKTIQYKPLHYGEFKDLMKTMTNRIGFGINIFTVSNQK